MTLLLQKRLARAILKISPYKIKIKTGEEKRVLSKKTRKDIRYEINRGNIFKEKIIGQVRHKGLKKQNEGSIKGSRVKYQKRQWILKIRAQRKVLKINKRTLPTTEIYRQFYLKIKGNYFKNKKSLLQRINK
jgi:large subunit ribosomal protein L19e